MTPKEWLVPGIIITLLSSGASFAGNLAVKSYKIDQSQSDIRNVDGRLASSISDLKRDLTKIIEESQRDTNDRFRRLDERLDKMGATNAEVARLQQKCEDLESRLFEARGDIKSNSEIDQARYDQLNNKLSEVHAKLNRRQIEEN